MWDFSVDKVASGPVFSDYFGFLCQFRFHQVLHICLPSSPSSLTAAGARGRKMTGVPSGLTLTPLCEFTKADCQVEFKQNGRQL
jgi:hypothetical protein